MTDHPDLKGYAVPMDAAWSGNAPNSSLRLVEAFLDMRSVMRSAAHALRSYQYGNGSSDLAKAVADKVEAELMKPHVKTLADAGIIHRVATGM